MGKKLDIYAGILGGNQYRLDTTKNSTVGDIRIGIGFEVSLGGNVLLAGWGYWDSGVQPALSLGINWKPNAHWTFSLGDIPSPAAALLRPLPVTGSGQFEVTAQSRITGKAPGLRAQYQYSAGRVLGGVHLRNFKPEYHLAGQFGRNVISVWNRFTFAGWVRPDTVIGWGYAMQYEDKRFFALISAKNSEVGVFISAPAPGLKDYRIFADVGCFYQKEGPNIWKIQAGIQRNWKIHMVNLKVVATWTLDPQAFNLYVLCTL